MRIGVYFTPTKNQGGIYSYSVSVLEALSRIKDNKYFVLSVSSDIPKKFRSLKNFKIVKIIPKERLSLLKLRDLTSYLVGVSFPSIFNIFYKLGLFGLVTPIYKFAQKRFIDIFEKEKLDVIFYVASSNLSFLVNTPAIVAVHDLQHKLNPQFKEVSADGRWENREYTFTNISKNAYRIFVDSKIGKEDVVNCYHTNPDKVVSLPYLAPSNLDTKISVKDSEKIAKKIGLPEKFIFYPAKFWPHKNHLRLVKALYLLKKRGKIVNIILTGSKDAEFSTFGEVMKFVKDHGLEKQVFYLGYVDIKQLSVIYKFASALVMPTFFGPTNIPILEAWVMGTPVITSNIRGCKDQLGNAGLLVDPKSSADMAKEIWKIYNNGKLRKILIKRGKVRVNKWTFEDFSKRIAVVLEDFKEQKNDSSKNN